MYIAGALGSPINASLFILAEPDILNEPVTWVSPFNLVEPDTSKLKPAFVEVPTSKFPNHLP